MEVKTALGKTLSLGRWSTTHSYYRSTREHFVIWVGASSVGVCGSCLEIFYFLYRIWKWLKPEIFILQLKKKKIVRTFKLVRSFFVAKEPPTQRLPPQIPLPVPYLLKQVCLFFSFFPKNFMSFILFKYPTFWNWLTSKPLWANASQIHKSLYITLVGRFWLALRLIVPS